MENYVAVNKILVQQLGSSAAEKHFSKSIFAIIIGSNDLFDYFGSSNLRKKNNPQQFVDLMANTLKGQLKVTKYHHFVKANVLNISNFRLELYMGHDLAR